MHPTPLNGSTSRNNVGGRFYPSELQRSGICLSCPSFRHGHLRFGSKKRRRVRRLKSEEVYFSAESLIGRGGTDLTDGKKVGLNSGWSLGFGIESENG